MNERRPKPSFPARPMSARIGRPNRPVASFRQDERPRPVSSRGPAAPIRRGPPSRPGSGYRQDDQAPSGYPKRPFSPSRPPAPRPGAGYRDDERPRPSYAQRPAPARRPYPSRPSDGFQAEGRPATGYPKRPYSANRGPVARPSAGYREDERPRPAYPKRPMAPGRPQPSRTTDGWQEEGRPSTGYAKRPYAPDRGPAARPSENVRPDARPRPGFPQRPVPVRRALPPRASENFEPQEEGPSAVDRDASRILKRIVRNEPEVDSEEEVGPRKGPRFRLEQGHLELAAKVVERSTKAEPADRVLHEVLRREKELDQDSKRDVVDAVFAYYRWRSWTNGLGSVYARILKARDLARRFATNPFSLPEDSLRGKAVPDWLPAEMETPVEWLRALQRTPQLWLRARPGKAREVMRSLKNCTPLRDSALPDALEYNGSADLFSTAGFESGAFEIQDISSQAVGHICGAKPGETWWDVCAGEGGKTCLLSDLMQNQGLIWSSDRAEWRLQRLKRRTARLKIFNYRTVEWDGSAKPPTKTKFDGVLVDGPCSGIGTWQRNPHARWTVTPEDVRELAALQLQLLNHACGSVKPGGKLVFSVCTLTRAETTELADQFAAAHPEFEPLPVVNPIQPTLPPSARITFWPHQGGGNGMFVAVWRRREE